MTIPNAATAPPVVTDEEVLARARELVQRVHVRQLWLLLLDERARQHEVLPIIEIPAEPEEPNGFAPFLHTLADATEALEVVPVLERRGRLELHAADRAWFRMRADAAAEAELRMRGPLLAHTRGVRWVAREDFALDAGAASP